MQEYKRYLLKDLRTRHPDGKIILVPEKEPTEFVCELPRTNTLDKQSTAIVVIEKSKPHFHKHTTEVYLVERGNPTLYIDDRVYLLSPGDVAIILPGQRHWAEGNLAWVRVVTTPQWDASDYHLV
ncbi:MAG: cupin domain-containing protein [Candidatus Adlerbacteria bacterium]|nr:cupin domain-containing protein [Candidatus Adlerbacteria bacterium]